MKFIILATTLIILLTIIIIQTIRVHLLINHCDFLYKSYNNVALQYSECLDERIKENNYFKNELERMDNKLKELKELDNAIFSGN